MEKYTRNDTFKYASEEAMRAGGDDPRLAAQAAEQAYRRSAMGHAETVAKSGKLGVSMTAAREYVPSE